MHSSVVVSFFAVAITAVSAVTKPVTNTGNNPTSNPGFDQDVTAGQPLKITWKPTTAGTISIVLLHGCPGNCLPIGDPIAEKVDNSGEFTWTPLTSLHPDDTYGIELIADSNGDFQTSPHFNIVNPAYVSSSSSSSVSSTTTSASSSSSASVSTTQESSTTSESSSASASAPAGYATISESSTSSSSISSSSLASSTSTSTITSEESTTATVVIKTSSASTSTASTAPLTTLETSKTATTYKPTTASVSKPTGASPTTSTPPAASNAASVNGAKTGMGLMVGFLGFLVAAF